ncbi:hypothetical protein [Senegalia massiliensis]|uniref:hypothetical protein n=1 Tax=Senegalia massiliensis TaxID=1720316 RepID=UPI0013626AA9|nr:hypothetical protein [Senegalia massiliensis]
MKKNNYDIFFKLFLIVLIIISSITLQSRLKLLILFLPLYLIIEYLIKDRSRK